MINTADSITRGKRVDLSWWCFEDSRHRIWITRTSFVIIILSRGTRTGDERKRRATGGLKVKLKLVLATRLDKISIMTTFAGEFAVASVPPSILSLLGDWMDLGVRNWYPPLRLIISSPAWYEHTISKALDSAIDLPATTIQLRRNFKRWDRG